MLLDPFTLFVWFIQVSVVSAAALLVGVALGRRTALRHGVYVAGVVILVFTPLLAWMMRGSQRAIFTLSADRIEAIAPHWVDQVAVANTPAATFVCAVPAAPADRGLQRAWATIQWVWLSVAAVLLTGRMVGCWRAWRWARRAPQLVGRADSRVRVAENITGPMSVGLFRPIVLLPAALVDRLTETQLDEVLTHEFAHGRRGDHVVAAVQQLLGAVLWPHVLIHLLNRELNRAREELCDNEVLAGHDRVDYAATLLGIAQWMNGSGVGRGELALSLMGEHRGLTKRIQRILDERRTIVTHPNRKSLLGFTTLLVMIAVASASVQLACATAPANANAQATQPATQPSAMHEIPFQIGDREFYNGDDIEITSVQCSGPKMAKGETIEVHGTYLLATCKEATLALSLTETEGGGKGPWGEHETVKVQQGQGEFVLTETLTSRGWPHVSFYLPATATSQGGCIDGVYFGQDQWLLSRTPWPHNSKVADAAKQGIDIPWPSSMK